MNLGSRLVLCALATLTMGAGGMAWLPADPCKNHYILVPPVACSWQFAASMSAPRYAHTATLLRDGRVLVAGGNRNPSPYPGAPWVVVPGVDSAELYDPASGAWTPAGPLTRGRYGHTATLLKDGRVLVVGGESSYHHSQLTAGTAEIFDPVRGTWTPTSPMESPLVRSYHSATLLPDGKVIVVGGTEVMDGFSFPTEIYDPDRDRWTVVRDPAIDRYGHGLTPLADGRLLLTSGVVDPMTGASTNAAELFDPVGGLWAAARPGGSARSFHTSTLLMDGRVVVTGGAEGRRMLSSAEVYDPATGAWQALQDLRVARRGHTTTLLSDGSLLTVGGLWSTGTGPWFEPLDSVELRVHPDRVLPMEHLREARAHHTATRLMDGSILVVGGLGTGHLLPLRSVELLPGVHEGRRLP